MNKIKLKTLGFILLFIFSIVKSYSQNPYYIFTLDSLKGFDQKAALKEMRERNLDPEDQMGFMYWKKRSFVDAKYNLASPQVENNNYQSSSYFSKGPGGNNQIMAAPCVNEGFESNVLAPWVGSRGANSNSCNYPLTPTVIPLGAPFLQINTTPFFDPIVGVVPNSPFPGNKVLQLNDNNNTNPFFSVVKASQQFSVTSTNFLYEFAYIMIANGSNHLCCDMPYMYVRIRDAINILQTCPNFSILPPAVTTTASCPGIGPTTWTTVGGNTYNQGWQKYSIDLTPYMNQNVTVEVFVSDCAQGGHYGYGYFDSNCNTFGITVNNATVFPAPTQTVNVQAPCATTATLSAPTGLNPYNWNGPPLSAIVNNTNQTISTSVPGDYTLTMNPIGVCNPIVRIVRLSFIPPLGAFATPTAICTAGSNSVAVLTATGATNYTWTTIPVSNSSTVAVSPTATTIYTVTGNTSTCTTTQTLQVLVNTSPTIAVNSSSNVLCSSGTITLTAAGATSYTWLPGSLTGSAVAVSPTASTNYTVLGANGGCPGQATIGITVISSPTVSAFSSASTVCPGGNANLFAGGAFTYTWQPGNFVGSNFPITPAATTIYTVTGQILSCFDTETVQVTVASGPTLSIIATPTTVCSSSGGTAQLVASGAVSYTWMPGFIISPTLNITPTATTIYTVTGASTLLCLSTTTISFSVTPTPTLNISASSTAICAGNSATLTGSGATNYTWSPGALTTPVIVVTPAANITYTLTGANGNCVSTNTIALVVNANPTITASSSPTVLCSGNSSTLSALGALTYTWNPGALSGASVAVTPAATTNYTVTGSNAAGCTATAVAIVSVNISPTLNPIAIPPVLCIGNTGTLVTGGANTYTWNPGNLSGPSVTVSPASTTIYTVSGTIGNCIDTKTVNLIVNPIPTVTALSNPTVICSGNSATLSGLGATSYTWNPGALSGATVAVTPAVNTTYTVIGSNGTCTSSAVVSVSVNSSPTLTAVANPTGYCAGSGGTSTLTGTGATTYTWNPGSLASASVVVSPLATTVYTLSGSNGVCTSTAAVTVSVSPIPTLNVIASPTVICSGQSTTLSATGASSYTWNPGALIGTSVVVSPTINTTYTVIGGNGLCTTTAVVSVSVNANPTVSANSSPTLICSGNSATLTGNGAITYTWNPGILIGSPVTVTPSITTQYSITGANSAGCTASAVVTVSVNPTPTLNPIANPTAICIGNTATLSTGGATSYTWNPGNLSGSSVTVSPLSTTIYTVIGSSNNCTDTKTVSLIVNPNPTVTAASNPTAICIGNTATLTGSGATNYTWSPGSLVGTSVTVSPATTTIYTVVGTNTSGCTSSNTVQLIVNPLPTVTAVANATSICQGSGGSSTLSANGASTYVWNPGALPGATVVVTPVVSTTYTVVGTSSLGCTSSQTVSVQIIPNPTVSASAAPLVICAGNSSTLTGTGATNYTWTPGPLTGSSVVVSPTTTTTYTLIGANAQCISTLTTIQVSVNPLPTFTLSTATPTICSGQNAFINVLGTHTSFTAQPGNIFGTTVFGFTGFATVPSTVTYTVTGSNAFGCTSTRTIQITINPNPTITASASPSNVCNGGTTTLTASGATSYTWNPGVVIGGTVVVTPTANTIYTVTGTTSNCSSTRTVLVNVGTTPTLVASASPTLKCGPNPATLTASGATSYTWFPGSLVGSTVVVNPFGTTVYTVVGANGSCTSIATVTLFSAPIPNVNAFANPVFICNGGSSTLAAIGATSYTWQPGSVTGQTIVVTPTATTVYTVTGANAAGCTNTATRTVNVIPTPTITIVASQTSICNGQTTTLTASGANSYTWSPTAVTNSVLNVIPPLGTTVFTVTGNIGQCSSTKTISILVNPNPTITASASSTLICASSAATLTASGTNSYTWQPGALVGSTVFVNPLVTTVYTVTGANLSGCTNTAAVTVSISPGPTVTVNASSNTICAGASITLTPTGATAYTLYPSSATGTVFAVTPTLSTTYTVLGANSVGCPGVSTIQIFVNPIPAVTISIVPSNSICIGTTATLTASGASTYTWLTAPFALTPTIIDTPTSTTPYTVVVSSTAGCVSSQTAIIYVTPVPTITVVGSNSIVCQSGTVSLTAGGATNYTWMPGSLTGSTVIVTPTAITVYTVTGNNGGCSSTATIQIDVTPGPQNVTANATGTITCFVSSVGLLGNTTSTNVTYLWNGPASYTSSVQNPTPITQSGTYTLTVVDLNTGCPISVTTAVIGNTTVPNFTVVSSGNLGCNTTVTLIASSSTSAGITYTWSGPGSFTAAIPNPTINIAGDYTVSAFDISSGCVSSLTISVLTDTALPIISATIIPATCTGTSTNNDGTIVLGPNGVKFDLVSGPTYTGTANYLTATPVPTNGIITNTLANPSFTTAYTIRIFGFNGCFKDTTLILQPINCFNNIFGLTKAASTPSLINNKYEVTFTVTAVNASFANLTNVILNENLSSAFPNPSTYTIISPPVITSQGSSLTINPSFDGSTQISLTSPSTSTLLTGKRDTIVFKVRIDPKGFFGPYFNSVIGFANDVNSLVVSDSSNDGFLWDPDGFPTNNNNPTVINIAPNTRLGISKAGKLSDKLSDNTYDITYVVTVKNFGNDSLKFVQVKDSINKTVPFPANFTIKNAPSVTGTLLTANTAFNGITDINLLSGLNTLAPGDVDTVRFTINVKPDTVTVIRNTAMGYAVNQFSTATRDSSQTGYNPDANGNGNPNEVSDSDPTVIIIPSSDLFVPDVFTPNDDGKNDKFVIKGINGRKVKLTVFNRWGNKVYDKAEYDNTWDGYPNANGLILGNNRLPQGTYYFIVEFADGKDKTMTGYVVLQY
jgi:gliding motility-associated-like protein